jgi:hypothetical protein
MQPHVLTEYTAPRYVDGPQALACRHVDMTAAPSDLSMVVAQLQPLGPGRGLQRQHMSSWQMRRVGCNAGVAHVPAATS